MHLTEDDREHLYRVERVVNALLTDLETKRRIRIMAALRELLKESIRAHGMLLAVEPDEDDGE